MNNWMRGYLWWNMEHEHYINTEVLPKQEDWEKYAKSYIAERAGGNAILLDQYTKSYGI